MRKTAFLFSLTLAGCSDNPAGGGHAVADAGSQSEAGPDLTDGATPSGPERARESPTHSYCDEASEKAGIYLPDTGGCVQGATSSPACADASSPSSAYLVDLSRNKIEGTWKAQGLSDDEHYLEFSLASLSDLYRCDQLADLVVVLKTSFADGTGSENTATHARVWDGRSPPAGTWGHGISWPECTISFDDTQYHADRLDAYAILTASGKLLGPQTSRVVNGTLVPSEQKIAEECTADLIMFSAWYLADELLFVIAN